MLGARFRGLLQYRAAAWAGVGTQLFFGLVRCMVFDAFYRSSAGAAPLSREQAISYIWLGQATFALVLFGIDNDVREMVRTGSVAYELCRPVDFFGFWYARAVASRAAPLLLRAWPQLLIAPLLGLQAPDSLAGGLAWLAATAGALALSAAWATLLTTALLWTTSGEGVVRIAYALPWLFSGIVVPLPLWPDWLQPICRWQPFAGVLDLPFRLYLGHLPPVAVWGVLALQAGWILVFTLVGRLLLSRGLRRLTAQGG